jgi:predicted nucleotidyltransferase
MRLNSEQLADLKRLATESFGADAVVCIFGSRVDDAARGGDVDILVEVPTPIERPALAAARLAARMSRALLGRNVDVVLRAPNLAVHPIHDIARRRGQRL